MNTLLDRNREQIDVRDERFWEKIRSEFLLDPNYIHLSLAVVTPHPKRVRDAIQFHRQNFDINPAKHYKKKDEMQRQVVEAAAKYLSTPENSIALTESTTMGLAIVLGGMQIFPGEEILTTDHEHYACKEMLNYKARDSKSILRRTSLYQNSEKASEEEIIGNIKKGITDSTRLLMLTWVHSATGVKLPLSRISKEIQTINQNRHDNEKILICVDALHGFGIENFAIEDLEIDFFIAGCHKCLFGPRGTGIIWGSELGWERVRPIFPSFDIEVFWPWYEGNIPSYVSPKARLCSPGGFGAFEHKWSLKEAFEFQLSIGKQKVKDRIQQLKSYAHKKMENLEHIKIFTPNTSHLSSGMICFDVKGIEPHRVVEFFEERKIMIGQTPYRNSLCRFSLSILNKISEIDQAISVLTDLG